MLHGFYGDVLVKSWAKKEKCQTTNLKVPCVCEQHCLGSFACISLLSLLLRVILILRNTIALYLSFIPICDSWHSLCDLPEIIHYTCMNLFQKLHLICFTISIQLNATIISWQTMHRPPAKVHGGHKDEWNVDPVLSEYSIDNSYNSYNKWHLLNVHLVRHSVNFPF